MLPAPTEKADRLASSAKKPRIDGPADAVPSAVLRQWSDAVAAAGLFAEALKIHPALVRADLVRQVELAVLAGDHTLALLLLAELESGRTERSATTAQPEGTGSGKGSSSSQASSPPRGSNSGQGSGSGRGKPSRPHPVSPWLLLLTQSAQLLAGQPGRLPAVLAAAQKVEPSPGVAWVVALAAATAGNLSEAGAAADRARAGGCRDLRMLAISAAHRAADGADSAAIDLVGRALPTALPDEDPAGYAIELLDRVGQREAAQRLAASGAGDSSQPALARAAWKAGARLVGAGNKGAARRSLTAVSSLGELHRNRQERRRQVEALHDLTCRCSGSAGWIGDDRLPYVTGHLDEVLPAPIPGLSAALLRCRATNLTFLDFTERQLTLPVVSELIRPQTRDPAGGSNSEPNEGTDDGPTPGMGVSLGNALPA